MKGKRKGVKISLIMLIISLGLIGSGIYLEYLSSPKRIIYKAVENLASAIYSTNDKEENIEERIIKIQEKDNFTIYSNIKINANSPYLVEKSLTDQTYIPYINFFKNITNTENIINLAQDNNNKKLLLTIDSYLYNQPFINRKYLIQDATEYQYITGFKDNYINNGNNNYFEISNEKLEYLYSTINNSLKNNLIAKSFTTTKTEIIINNEKQISNQVSLVINSKNSKEILNSTIKDLKQDKLLSSLLNTIDAKTNILKTLNDAKLLKNNEKIIFNIYTDKIGNKNLKYEIILSNGENNITFSYECDTNRGYIIKNNEVIYNYQINNNSSDIKIDILSKENKNIGSLLFEKTSNGKALIFNFDNGNINSASNYNIEKTIIEDNYLYSTIQQFNLRITNKTTELINISVIINSNIENKAKIEEDVSSSIFKSSITDTEKETYTNQMIEKLNQLYQ